MNAAQIDTVEIQLPVEWRDRMKVRATERGKRSTADYIRELIEQDIEPQILDEETERLILEGLDSGPAEPIDEQFWQERRRKLEEYIKAKQS